jgi:SAM-dependent methyltransferase
MQMPLVLDVCCGPRGFWFDRHDARALFVDRRRGSYPIDVGTPGTKGRSAIIVEPDVIASFDQLPFANDQFALVVFDPPHVRTNTTSGALIKRYGNLTFGWQQMLRHGFAECFRVLRPEGVLVFKWAESDCPVSEILALTDKKPLFGQQSLRKPATHWVVFMKDSV